METREIRGILFPGTVRIEYVVSKILLRPPDVDDYFLIRMLDRFTQLLAPTCLVTR